jgi:cytoskeletal protein CcmA (bactofilin family)
MPKKLKASSLMHAVFVCFLIAAVCFGMLMLSSYTTLFQKRTVQVKQLQLTNDAAIQLAVSKIPTLENGSTTTSVFDDHILTNTKIMDWGFYKVICAKTYFKQDTIQRTILLGKATKSNTALYVTNYDKIVNVAGNVSITGNIKVPKGILDKKNMKGEQTNISIQGTQEKSENLLPRLRKLNTDMIPNSATELSVTSLEKEKVYVNSFDQNTQVLNTNSLSFLAGKKLKGNIMIQSNGILVLKANMQLEDIIIKAKKVIVEKGFRGNVQIIAENGVTVAAKVQLLYPSSILIQQPKNAANVTIGKESVLMGGIVMTNSDHRTALKSMVAIDENSTIVGDIYCHGALELKGNVYGSVYADRLLTKTDESSYANLLMNATIDLSKLPENFIGIPLFEDKKVIRYETVKEL